MARRNCIVPRWMNFVSSELDLFELLVGHFDSGLIFVRIQDRLDFESGARLGTADQIDDRLIVDQWLSSPMQTDKREQSM